MRVTHNIQEGTEAGLHLVPPQSYKAIKHHLLNCFYIIHNNQSHLYTKKHRLIQNMVDQFYVNNVYKQVYKNIVTLTMQTALL